MRLAMRVLFILAVPGIVFGWLTRVPPLAFDFDIDFGFSRHEVGWLDVLAALICATSVVAIVALAIFVMVKLGIDDVPRSRRPAR